MKAIVLGSVPGSGNIGDAIAGKLRSEDWLTFESDCWDDVEKMYLPYPYDMSDFDACVITLGATKLAPMGQVSDDDIRAVIYGSLELPLLCIRRYVQTRQKDGRIIVIGSYAHDHSLTNCSPYCAAKAGLTAAIKELAWELTPDFFTHIIHPYHVPSTPMGERVVREMMEFRGMTREEAMIYQRKDRKLPFHLTPDDIANMASWLLKEPSAVWLSGQGLSLYGGVR